ncbi:MAG: TIR domain-containing protein [Clostridia bacterium]|nr:TIR domain-containing protein [Clostridia bacterium]
MVIECKNCGDQIEVEEGAKTVVCEICGMEQTLPKNDSPEKIEEFLKANEYRRNNRFDVAKSMYQELIAKYPEDNEAYWCKILCEYGIEYVEDDLTERNVPTCHRTVRESIFDNKDYKFIISRASEKERAIFETEAKEIDRIQKEILDAADKAEPYDIFICYKESDSNGKRTKDSQIANRIYTNLTNKGYKVFFSRVTLKNMAGAKYEPIIFSALSSAKVMLHVTTSAEYSNAPWVRNEWSRYLEFMGEDDEKVFVPCIANTDMDAYDLPEELKEFQALNAMDMDFTENLTRQIDSKFGRLVMPAFQSHSMPTQSAQASVQPTQAKVSDPNQEKINNLIRRIQLTLEDKDWERVDEFAEDILNIDAGCGHAYKAKLLCEYRCSNLDELAKQKGIENNLNYKKILRFADAELKKEVEKLSNGVSYYNAQPYLTKDLTVDANYKMAKDYLTNANGYKDANRQLADLEFDRERQILAKKEGLYKAAMPFVNGDLSNEQTYNKAKEQLSAIKGFKDVDSLLAELPKRREEKIKENHYKLAQSYMAQPLTDAKIYQSAKENLEKARGYKDADQLLAELPLTKKFQEQKKNYDLAKPLLSKSLLDSKNYKLLTDYLEKARGYKDAEALLDELPLKRKQEQIEEKYKTAKTIMGGDLTNPDVYADAEEALSDRDLAGYKDVDKLLKNLPKMQEEQDLAKKYAEVQKLLKKDLTDDSVFSKLKELLSGMLDYKDSYDIFKSLDQKQKEQREEKILAEKRKHYNEAKKLYNNLIPDDNYRKAKDHLKKAGSYSDAKSLLSGIDRERNKQIQAEAAARKRRQRERVRNAIANADALLKGFIIMLVVGIVVAGVILGVHFSGVAWGTLQWVLAFLCGAYLVALIIVVYCADNYEHNNPFAVVIVTAGFSVANLILGFSFHEEYVVVCVALAIVLTVMGLIFTIIQAKGEQYPQAIITFIGMIVSLVAIIANIPWGPASQWIIVIFGSPILIVPSIIIVSVIGDDTGEPEIPATVMLSIGGAIEIALTYFIPDVMIIGIAFGIEMLILTIVALSTAYQEADEEGYYTFGGIAIVVFLFLIITNTGWLESCLGCLGCDDCSGCELGCDLAEGCGYFIEEFINEFLFGCF